MQFSSPSISFPSLRPKYFLHLPFASPHLGSNIHTTFEPKPIKTIKMNYHLVQFRYQDDWGAEYLTRSLKFAYCTASSACPPPLIWGRVEPSLLSLRTLLAYCTSPWWWWWWNNWWNDCQGKPKYSEKTCPVPLCPPQIPHDLAQTRTWPLWEVGN
jgi:hypothetical protein